MSSSSRGHHRRHHRHTTATNHHHHGSSRLERDPFEPLCELRVADSVFLGYALSSSSSASSSSSSLTAVPSNDDDDAREASNVNHPDGCDESDEDDDYRHVVEFRRRLIESRHLHAEHVPWCAVNDDRWTSQSHSSPSSSLSSYRCDDDGEPTNANIGRTLLMELRRNVRKLERQRTMRMRGGGGGGGSKGGRGRRGRCGSWDDEDVEDVLDDRREGGSGGEEDESDEDEEDVKSLSAPPPTSSSGSSSSTSSSSSSFSSSSFSSPSLVATAVIVVRYFGKRHLGVTSGRLRDLYARTARLALHRHANGMDSPFVERYRQRQRRRRDIDDGGIIYDYRIRRGNDNATTRWIDANLYGLGAGDCELILDVVDSCPPPPPPVVNSTRPSPSRVDDAKDGRRDDGGDGDGEEDVIVRNLLRELEFERMVGPENAPLPRLQNLQADMLSSLSTATTTVVDDDATKTIVPVYRYPGNYSGLEYPTHPWSHTSAFVKRAVESALRPLYVQGMNHCVTNLYRDGHDDIQHHSDKDLDLNRNGVIASVSFGSSRVMEVRDRAYPHDVVRVDLPPRSMLVLGPYTNAGFTHAILPLSPSSSSTNDRRIKGEEKVGVAMTTATPAAAVTSDDVTCNVDEGGRISLTFRDVRTFWDARTQRLFGQGVATTATMTTTTSLSPFSGPSGVDTNEDGSIREGSLIAAMERVRKEDGRDRRSAAAIALVIGTMAGYISSKSSSEGGTFTSRASGLLTLLHDASIAAMTGSASYWYIRRRRREIRLQREEDGARAFFSKKSASGNKY